MCSTCDRRFSQKNDLHRHQATHTDERKFKCEVCLDKRSFKTKCQLTNHMKFHYEPKHWCLKCGKKFHRSDSLKQHEKTHRS